MTKLMDKVLTEHRFSENLWKRRGLLGTYAGVRTGMQTLIEAYRGEVVRHAIGGVMDDEMVDINTIFELRNTLEAQLAARAPKALMFSRSRSDPQRAERSSKVQALTNYYIGELKMKRQVNRAFTDFLLSGFGVVRHGFTPRDRLMNDRGDLIEPYGYAKAEVPWVRRYGPWNFRADTLQDSLMPEESRWCAFLDYYTEGDMKRMGRSDPKLTVPRNLDQATPTGSPGHRTHRNPELEENVNPDAEKLYEVWTRYDRLERTWMMWSPSFEKELRPKDDWPLPWEHLPYSLLGPNEQMDDPFPVSPLEMVWPLIRERNLLRTMMSINARQTREFVIFNEQALEEKTKQQIKNTGFSNLGLNPYILGKEAANTVMSHSRVGGFEQGLLIYDQMLEQSIRQTIGTSKLSRGQRENVESATEANYIQAGDNTQQGRLQSAFEDFWGDIITEWLHGTRATIDEDTIVPILGPEDTQMLLQVQGTGPTVGLGRDPDPFITVDVDSLHGDYMVRVEVATTKPESKNEDRAKAMAWLDIAIKAQGAVDINEALIGVALAFDKDPSRVIQSLEEREATSADQNRRVDEGDAMNGPAPKVSTSPDLIRVLTGGA